MNTRYLRALLAIFIGVVFSQTSFAGNFVFDWTAPAQVNVGESYTVKVDVFYGSSDASSSDGFNAFLYRGSNMMGHCGGTSTSSVQQSFTDNTAQTVTYRVEGQSYTGTYDVSYRSVVVNSVGIPTTFTFSGSGQTYDGTTKYLIATPNPSNAPFTISGNWGVGAGTYVAFVAATGQYVSNQPAVNWTIEKATPVITWAPGPITYGTALSDAQRNATANVSGTFSYSVPAGTVLGVGSHTLTATFTPSDTTNYVTGVSKTVNLTVNPAPLTITAGNASKTYGAANPGVGASFSGFVNGDSSSVVSGLQLNTLATTGSPIGNYAIVPSGASAANYAISYLRIQGHHHLDCKTNRNHLLRSTQPYHAYDQGWFQRTADCSR